LVNSFNALINPAYARYWSNRCIDQRINDTYGSQIAAQDYQELCQTLAYDFNQIFMEYRCNNWTCNFKGNCRFNITDDLVNVGCNCSSGFGGNNCIFSLKDIEYMNQWIIGLNNYLNRAFPINTLVSDLNTFMTLMNMTDSLLTFAPNVQINENFAILLENLYDLILTANVTVNEQTRLLIFNFVNDMITESYGDSGVNPIDTIMTFSGDSTINTTNFGSVTAASNPKADITLSVTSRRVLLATSIYSRFLASTSNTTGTNGMNMAAPTVVVPKSVSASLPTSAKFQLTFIRDPRTYSKPGAPVMNSQIITVSARSNNLTYLFPTGATPLNITIPWAFVPLNIVNQSTYQQSCSVYSYTNSTWNVSNTCRVSNTTNNMNAVIECSQFSTLGVSCKNARVDISSIYTKNSTANSSFIAFAYGLILVLGLLLF
jgi:hypothetical protein